MNSSRHRPLQSPHRIRGRINYESGLAAEDIVARTYLRNGGEIVTQRWRGRAGEVDLIVRQDGDLVFVEVKKAKNFARAAESLSARQMRRVYDAASEFCAMEPDGLLTQIRFVVALVNAVGETEIMRNVSLI